jgi:hypothetical protein
MTLVVLAGLGLKPVPVHFTNMQCHARHPPPHPLTISFSVYIMMSLPHFRTCKPTTGRKRCESLKVSGPSRAPHERPRKSGLRKLPPKAVVVQPAVVVQLLVAVPRAVLPEGNERQRAQLWRLSLKME